MSLRIEIKSPVISEINGTSKAGKPYSIRKQSGWAYTFDQEGNLNPYPERIEINLADNQPAYPIGNYTLSDKCIYVGDFNSLTVGRLILDSVATPQRAAA